MWIMLISVIVVFMSMCLVSGCLLVRLCRC